MKIKTEIKKITPEEAARLLSKPSGMQRPLNLTLALRYSQTMSRGDWRLTHQGLMLGPDEVVIDGQHRLKGVELSGQTLDFMVSRIEDATPSEIKGLFDATDFGKPRHLGFILQSVHAVPNANRTASALSAIVAMTARFRYSMLPDQAMDVYKLFKPQLEQIGNMIASEKSMQRGPLIGALSFIIKLNEPDLLDFASKTITGEDLARNHPAYLLRHSILNGTSTKRRETNVPSICLWTCSCALAVIEKRSMTKLVSSYGPLDRLCEMLPTEVSRVRAIVGQAPNNFKRDYLRAQKMAEKGQ